MSNFDFTVNVSLESQAITNDGFGSMLILDNEHDIPYTVIKKVEDLTKNHNVLVEDRLYKLAEGILNQDFKPSKVIVIGKVGETGEVLVEALKEAIKIDNDFFYIVSTDNSDGTIKALSNQVETIEKIYATTTSNVELLDGLHDDLELKERVIIACHNDDNFMGEKLAAKLAGISPGKTVGKFHELKGVKASNFDDTERAQLEEKGSFTYKRELGESYTSEGLVLNGEYIDVVLGKYFIKSKLEEETLKLALRKSKEGSKIGYSTNGIAELVAVTDGVMTLGKSNNILTDYEISYKNREDTTKEDRQKRIYKGIRATGYLEGAIHKAEFNINLVV